VLHLSQQNPTAVPSISICRNCETPKYEIQMRADTQHKIWPPFPRKLNDLKEREKFEKALLRLEAKF
jgi:hypothetical protein